MWRYHQLGSAEGGDDHQIHNNRKRITDVYLKRIARGLPFLWIQRDHHKLLINSAYLFLC